MVKLRKVEKQKVNESKQVGTLYHVCNADAVANYIAPTDTLSASGNYKNWLKGGRSDYVSFTREKGFVVNTEATHQLFLFKFVVDGDLLSENYTVTPYNDFAWSNSGIKLGVNNIPTKMEFEEVVNGPIKSFSRYIEKILFTCNIKRFFDYNDLNILKTEIDTLQSCKSYVNKNHIEYSSEFCKMVDENNRLILNKYPISFNEVLHLLNIIYSIYQGSNEYIKEYLKWFNTDVFCVKDFLLENLSFDMIQKNIPVEFYRNELMKDYNLLDNNKIREMIEKYPPEINRLNRGIFITIINFLESEEFECCLTTREVHRNITQEKIDAFIQDCVKADTNSSFSLHGQLFSTLFRGLLNYDKIIKDIDTFIFTKKFNSLRGYDLISFLEKNNILSKEKIENILFSKS